MAIQKIIKFGRLTSDHYGELQGYISALGLGSTEIVSQEMTSREGNRYLKLIADPLGASYEIGAAFPKKKNGEDYYSVSLDSPLFPNPIQAALLPDKENKGAFNFIWSRVDSTAPSADVVVGLERAQRLAKSQITP